jgi:hypothetical protein
LRGLPPVPADVLRVELVIDVNGRELTTGWWWFVPDLIAGGVPWLIAAASNIFSYMVSPLDGCMHSGASWSLLRLSSGGTTPLVYSEAAPVSGGVYTGGQADAIATGVYVLSSTGRRGSGSRLRIPATPDDFVVNNYMLSTTGVGRLFDFAAAMQSCTAATIGPTGGAVILGTLQRSRAGAPLGVATFDPAAAVIPSFRVELLARRLPKSRGVSP